MDTCSFSAPQLVKVFFDLLLFLIFPYFTLLLSCPRPCTLQGARSKAQMNRFVYIFGQILEAFNKGDMSETGSGQFCYLLLALTLISRSLGLRRARRRVATSASAALGAHVSACMCGGGARRRGALRRSIVQLLSPSRTFPHAGEPVCRHLPSLLCLRSWGGVKSRGRDRG